MYSNFKTLLQTTGSLDYSISFGRDAYMQYMFHISKEESLFPNKAVYNWSHTLGFQSMFPLQKRSHTGFDVFTSE